jgi:SpoVK/Ycf46/Vps4 family AAA+-type ATPase
MAPRRILRQIASFVRARPRTGTGIRVLFCGDSGTGKTVAAEMLARDLRRDLYRVDLGTVISKYIGETEKNLERIFDAARKIDAILFFDEADALFGRRTEVRDGNDRYANLDVNYLLQRIEAHDGLVILASSLVHGIDPAFARRFAFLVRFPLQDEQEEKK